MNWTVYRKMTEKELLGRKVKTLRPLQNGYLEIPAGTIATIKRKFNGLELKTVPCAHCGASMRVTRVEPGAVVLL